MCGQFSLDLDAFTIQDEFDLSEMPAEWEIRPNIFPSQMVAVIKAPEIKQISMMRWGLVPNWAKDEMIGRKMFNARSETLLEKPSFRKPFRYQRCLILANGFYEWKRAEGSKSRAIPYRFEMLSEKPFAFAGLWDVWSRKETPLQTCTIITCTPNELVKNFHDRMPVILPKESYQEWLSGHDLQNLQHMLSPFTSDLMRVREVDQSDTPLPLIPSTD
ncbi:MAG: SOS response-associated peptidase [Anaerolineaceae bacterium]|jgi:putative SOS response-associated peptidase YedK